MRELIITENEEGQRLDRFLGKYMKNAGKGFVEKVIRKKYVKVNGSKGRPANMLVKGDRLEIYLSEETLGKFVGEKTWNPPSLDRSFVDTLPIAYEDEELLVWDKPSGVLTHGAPDGVVETATAYLIMTGVYDPATERTFAPSSTNRLDKNTSGLVFIGKTNRMRMELNEKWRLDQVDKFYTTLIRGDLKQERRLDGYLTKDEGKNQSFIHPEKVPGSKEVTTIVRPIRGNETYTLVEVALLTGRSHQIRAHLQSIGKPVVGDPKYGEIKTNQQFRDQYGLNRQFLHNHLTVIHDYKKGQDLRVSSPLPKDLQDIVQALYGR
jgi:23S rRNA pseudouridine955/2504/2580 synthase